MLKLLALFDRYHNIRGSQEARHDREEAWTHAADLKVQLDPAQVTQAFVHQFLVRTPSRSPRTSHFSRFLPRADITWFPGL
jgi:hypothetical protein